MPFFAIDDVATQMALQCVAAPRGLSCPAPAAHPVITGDHVCSRPDPKADQRLLDCPPSRAMTLWDGDLADPDCLDDRCNCQIARAAKAPPPGSTGCRATHLAFSCCPRMRRATQTLHSANYLSITFINGRWRRSRSALSRSAHPRRMYREVRGAPTADVTSFRGALSFIGGDQTSSRPDAVEQHIDGRFDLRFMIPISFRRQQCAGHEIAHIERGHGAARRF